MDCDARYLYHVTTADAAEDISEGGYHMQDWLAAYDDWGLSLDGGPDWPVPDDIHHSLVGVAISERLLEAERLDGHPSRCPAGFFYSNPWTALHKMRTRDFGNTCVVIDPERLDGPIAHSPDTKVGVVFNAALEAVKYDNQLNLSRLREWARDYWLSVHGWAGNPHPYAEVYVPDETGVPPESVVQVLDDCDALRALGREGGYKRYNG